MISKQIDLTINKMTKAQYNGISPVADEVYVITDEAGCVTSVNGVQPDSSGNVTINIPSAVTESTVAGWGFTKNVGTVTSVNGVSPTNGNVAITIPTVNNGTLTITQDGNTLGTFGANQSRNTTVNIPSGGSSRNIGEIVSSTLPLTDAGLHLLDGALIQGDGIYADFVDYITGLDLTANYFCTEAEWQQSITDYGVCGKFVNTLQKYAFISTSDSSGGWYCNRLEVGADFYTASGNRLSTIASIDGNHITITESAIFPRGFDRDTTNDVSASVRLPKITGVIEGTTDLTALGDLVEAGLPNIIGNGLRGGQDGTVSGAFTKTSTGQSNGAGGNYGANYGLDASLSNTIYGNSTTVQPQTIKVLYYIVVATSTKTNIEVDIDEIATDLNGKADRDGSNINQSFSTNLVANMSDTANIYMSGLGMPSDTYIDLTLGASGSTYIAPANGYLFLNKSSTGGGQYVGISNNASGLIAQRISTANYQNLPCYLECKKGDLLYVEYSAGGTLQGFRFVYAQGSESEAN